MPRADRGHDLATTLELFAPPKPNERLSAYLARLDRDAPTPVREPTASADLKARQDEHLTTSEVRR